MKEEISVERMLRYVPNMFDVASVRCLNASCSDVGPFSSLNALAYHMMIKHMDRERDDESIPCLLCSDEFMTSMFLSWHLESEHGLVEDHMTYRERDSDEQTGRRAKEQKTSQSADGARSRSGSPEWSREVRDQRKMDELPPKETNDDDILPILNETLENRDDNDDDDGSSASSQHGDNREEDPQGSKQLKAKRSRVATDIEGGEENDTNDTITLGSESGNSSPEPAAQMGTESPKRKRAKPEWIANEEFLSDEEDGQEDFSVEIVDHHSKSALVADMELPFTPRAHSTPERPTPQNRAGPKSITAIPYPEFSPLNLDDVDADVVTVCIKPGDLSLVPVHFTAVQSQLLFSPLRPVNPKAPYGKHICSECEEVLNDGAKGRHHMFTHVRVIRFRCSLCKVGAFYRKDLRAHLMDGLCEELHRAPAGIVKPNFKPCMTERQADSLAELADVGEPGRAVFTSGKIVSEDNRKGYYPDPVIEERMLGLRRVLSLGFLPSLD